MILEESTKFKVGLELNKFFGDNESIQVSNDSCLTECAFIFGEFVLRRVFSSVIRILIDSSNYNGLLIVMVMPQSLDCISIGLVWVDIPIGSELLDVGRKYRW